MIAAKAIGYAWELILKNRILWLFSLSVNIGSILLAKIPVSFLDPRIEAYIFLIAFMAISEAGLIYAVDSIQLDKSITFKQIWQAVWGYGGRLFLLSFIPYFYLTVLVLPFVYSLSAGLVKIPIDSFFSFIFGFLLFVFSLYYLIYILSSRISVLQNTKSWPSVFQGVKILLKRPLNTVVLWLFFCIVFFNFPKRIS